MTRPAIGNSQYTVYRPNNQKTYNQNPIIDGYFPKCKTYKEMAVARVNRTLCSILILFIMLSAVSYYFVTASEVTLNKYRKQTLTLNDENVELQNKLDYLKSYYNVDKAMQKKNLPISFMCEYFPKNAAPRNVWQMSFRESFWRQMKRQKQKDILSFPGR